jgi:CubicO group peptidase (beta-lactamase class C family)
MNCRILWLLVAAAAVIAEASPLEESANSLAAKVDKLFSEWDKTNSPGFSLAISRNGTLLYERGYGMANLELGVPITPASVFHVASISKQFTAMCILLLAERGKLALDDEARKYIRELPDYGSQLTIRHLLNQTSGLRDAFLLMGLAPPREDGGSLNDAIVKVLARQRALNFKPGTEFQYNNGGYALLATIVSRVSGQSLRIFADENIFKPLDMAHTHVHDDPTMLVPNRASGYHQDSSGFHVAPHADLGRLVGTTALFTTARDLLLWEQNFVRARVGKPAQLAEMQKPAIATDWGDGSFYGFGLAIGEYRGPRMIGHGGGDPGYGAYVARFPDQGFAVAVLGNLDNVNPITLIQGVSDICLEGLFPTSSVTNSTSATAKVSLSAEQLAGKAGLYRDPVTEIVGRFFVRDGRLMASADTGEENFIELVPLDTNRFAIPGTKVVVEFIPVSNGRGQEARVTGVGPKPKVSQKLPPFTQPTKELGSFTGDYTSPEIEVTYGITARDSDLQVRMPGRPDVVLLPFMRDAFAGPVLGVAKFSRDSQGSITGFTVNTSGVRGLRFDRIGK